MATGTYGKAGVDISLGDEASRLLYEAARQTFVNREGDIGEVIVPFDDFSGVRAIDVSNLPEGSFMCVGFDGVGTKVEIAQRVGDHSTIAFDLLAMVCDDAIVRGAEPVLVGSVLDVASLRSNMPLLKQLAKGYVEAARAANVAVVNGELAELGDAIGGYGAFRYNWCASVVWFARKDLLFTGKEVKVGDSIVLLQEKGFRSNGLSLVRKTFKDEYGEEWHKQSFAGGSLGASVLLPSTIYSRAVVAMHGGFRKSGSCVVHGVVHVTGGGLPGKLARVLKPSGLGAVLKDLFEPCEAMLHAQQVGNISDVEAYRTWNMGQGLAVITPEPQKVVAEAARLGFAAKVAGSIRAQKGIVLTSRGAHNPDVELSFSG